MIEISFGKLVLIAVVALVVLGPEKLPGAARTVGALLRRVRTGWDSVRSEVERELEIEEIRRSAREAAAKAEAMKQQWDNSVQSVHKGAGELDQQVRHGIQPEAAPSVTAGGVAESAPASAGTTASAGEGASHERV
ncbi:Sec-independent protein translocase protein TatB [Frateuria aurantia]